MPLAGLIHAGDVVDPFEAIQIALVHGVDAHEARTPIGSRSLSGFPAFHEGEHGVTIAAVGTRSTHR